MTVFKNPQLCFKKLGYCPTTYMIHDAMTALFYFPFFRSHNCKSILNALMKNERSSRLSGILPHREPIIQDSEFKL